MKYVTKNDTPISEGGAELPKHCHSERSEESLFDPSASKKEGILRFAQTDNFLIFSAG